ncbi:MAG: hypothetical protein E4H01_15010, partial [Lysobacterales bacterium]
MRDTSTQLGVHEGGQLDITERRVPKKAKTYQQIFAKMYSDVWALDKPITWLDIGAGYGEVIEAIKKLALRNSSIYGIEPMKPKAGAAQVRGLN